MPEPLLDLSAYDLAKVEFDREAIARINPHRDGMSLVDGVIALDREKDLAVGYADAREDMFWIRGHFPGNPIFPGIYILEVAAQLSSLAYKMLVPEAQQRLMVFGGADHVRFRGMLKPGERMIVTSRLIQHNRRLCRSYNQGRVGGRLIFDGEILGILT